MIYKMTRCALCFTLLLLMAVGARAQSWTPEGPDDANQPAFYSSYYNAFATDKAGSFYVAYNGPANRLAVRKWNGAWQQVGTLGISADVVSYVDLAVAPGSVPYVVYKDFSNSRKVTVRKFDGTSWVNLGAAVSPGPGDYSRIAIDAQGNPVVAYVDSPATKKVTVKKWDGTAWQLVGAANFTAANITGLRLAMGSSQPQVLVQYFSSTGINLEVFRFDGTAWASIGAVTNNFIQNYFDLEVSKKDTTYVAFSEAGNNGRAAVRKYNGSAWVNIGNGGISPKAVSQLQIVHDSLTGLYLHCTTTPAAYIYQNYYPMISHYNGNGWETLGPDTFVVRHDAIGNSAIALDTDRKVHLLYGDGAYSSKLHLLKLNNNQWQALGTSRGLSDGPSNNAKVVAAPDGRKAYAISGSDVYADYSGCRVFAYDNGWTTIGQSGVSGWTGMPLDIAVDPGGHPWVALRDSSRAQTFSVWRYTGSSWVYTGLTDTVGYRGLSMTIDGSGKVLVAYKLDGSRNGGAGVYVYQYTQAAGWTSLSATPIGGYAVYDWATIKASSTGEPWLMAGGTISTSPYYSYYLDVYHYTGGSWVQAGSTIGSANGTRNVGPADFALDSLDVPYVIHPNSAAGAIKVRKYNSITALWEDIAAANSLSSIWYPSMQFGPNGRLYLSYTDYTATNYWRATTLQLDGAAFQAVGSTAYSASTAFGPRTAVLNNRLLTTSYDGAMYAYKYDCATPAIITLQPADVVVCAGSNTLIPMTATGATGYRWQANDGTGWKNIAPSARYSAVTDDTLLLSAVPMAINGTRFRCVLTNGCGGTVISNSVAVLVDTTGLPVPTISIATNTLTACAGRPVTFTSTTTNAGVRPTYEWEINSVPVAGAMAPTFTTSLLSQGDIVTGMLTRLSACGQPPVTAMSNAITMSITTTQNPAVTIAASPGTSISSGTAVTFTATVTNGGPAPQYQWLRNNTSISGQTAATYTSSSLANGDVITVRVTRGDTCAGTATALSNPLTMQVASSVGNLAGSYGVMVYPQPANAVLYLNGPAGAPAGDYKLVLYSVTGQTAFQTTVKLNGAAWSSKISIPAALPAGTYYLSLRGAVQLASGSVVISR